MGILLAADVPIPAVVPFGILLGCIAVLPLVATHWWEHNKNKGIVAALLSAPVVWWLLSQGLEGRHGLEHALLEYFQFIVLLGSLFTISGGIFLDGDLRATPKVNTCFFAVGSVIANLVGTTGAAMLLIRPLLRTNSQRKHITHTVVFFIFIVCNVGGCLTPLGDPPLFLGFLKGVPFEWTLRLWPEWLIVNVSLLAIYFVFDSIMVKKETPQALRLDQIQLAPLKVHGGLNLLLLGGVVALVAGRVATPYREVGMIVLSGISLLTTKREVRTRNGFSWVPIVEVAVLFIGIFITMVPALMLLAAKGKSLGVDTPMEFFWFTGILSSFLDNAPTYATFLTLAQSLGLPNEVVGVSHNVLAAISCGAVFMGANTYIGNGPNFMVKAIADSAKVKMPGFFGYMAWSGAILIPLFVVVSLVMFRGS